MGGNDECCSQHENLTTTLKEMNAKLDTIVSRLGVGDVVLATLDLRVKALEAKNPDGMLTRVDHLESVVYRSFWFGFTTLALFVINVGVQIAFFVLK